MDESTEWGWIGAGLLAILVVIWTAKIADAGLPAPEPIQTISLSDDWNAAARRANLENLPLVLWVNQEPERMGLEWCHHIRMVGHCYRAGRLEKTRAVCVMVFVPRWGAGPDDITMREASIIPGRPDAFTVEESLRQWGRERP